jgi:hypothetical protein
VAPSLQLAFGFRLAKLACQLNPSIYLSFTVKR